MPLNVQNCCASPPIFFDRIKTPLAISLLTAAFALVFFGAGGLLSHYKVLPNSIAWMDVGQAGNWTMAIFGIATGALSLYLFRKHSANNAEKIDLIGDSKESVITGKIFVPNTTSAGALGNRPEFLTSFSPLTDKIKRIDGVEWKKNPTDILVECTVRDLSIESDSLKSETTFYLPFSLFMKDAKDAKTDGDFIEFELDNMRFKLQIAQWYYTHFRFNSQTVPSIETAYKVKRGKPIVFENSEIDTTSYTCPLNTGKLNVEQQDQIDYQEFLKEHLEENEHTNRIEASTHFKGQTLIDITLTLPNSTPEKRVWFVRKTLFALIDTTETQKRLLRYPYGTLRQPEVQQAIEHARYDGSILTLKFSEITENS